MKSKVYKKTALIVATGLGIFSGNCFAGQYTGAGSTAQPSAQYQLQQQQQVRQQQQTQYQQQIQQARQAEAMRQQQLRQQQFAYQQQLQRQREAQARQNKASIQWAESPTFKTLERMDKFGQAYGKTVSRSLIGCGAAGLAGSPGGPVGVGVACASGAILSN